MASILGDVSPIISSKPESYFVSAKTSPERSLSLTTKSKSPEMRSLPTHSEEGVLDICYEVFGRRQGLPDHLMKLISSCIPPEEQAFIFNKKLPYFDTSHPLPALVNLSYRSVLSMYLAKGCRNDPTLSAVAKIAQRIYESLPRSIADTSNYGQAFSMNPEILARAMQLAKNQVVVEIAGASGENAILLACTEAQHVYLNDIEPVEIATFQTLKGRLPVEIQRKLTVIEGDCLELVEIKPELVNKVGLILCQNLIHFFNNKQQEKIFHLIKKMLRPCGRAIFTANSIYVDESFRKVFEEHPKSTSFTSIMCGIVDYEISTLPKQIIFQDLVVGDEEAVSTNFQKLHLYERNSKTSHKWQVNNDQLLKITTENSLRSRIAAAINQHKSSFKNIKHGTVWVLINALRGYSVTNLRDLAIRHGFDVETTFAVTAKGHTINDKDDLFNRAAKVGIIVRNL